MDEQYEYLLRTNEAARKFILDLRDAFQQMADALRPHVLELDRLARAAGFYDADPRRNHYLQTINRPMPRSARIHRRPK